MGRSARLNLFEKIQFFSILFGEQILGRTRLSRKVQLLREKFYYRLTQKLQNTVSKLPVTAPWPVPTIENLSSADFKKNFYQTSKPVVFKGAATNWPSTSKWTLDFFKDYCGDKNLLLTEADGLTSRHKNSKNFEVLSVADLITNISSGGDKYLRFSPLIDQLPELTKDLNLSWLSDLRPNNSIGNTYYLFMGGKGTVTHLHSDQPCNLFVQIYGQKKWTLIDVADSHLVYPHATQTAYFKCDPDLGQPDFSKYPLLQKAKRYEVVLNAGDVLYVPPHVWHYVENLTDTIGLGYRFSSVAAACRSSWAFTLLRICAQNPPFWKTIKYGKIDTNLIWSHANGTIHDVLEKLKPNAKN